MTPLIRALLSTWEWRPDVTVVLVLLGTLYVVGWRRLRRRSQQPKLATKRRLAAYMSGLAILAISLLSPIDLLGSQLFFMHMIQHMLMMMVAAPLMWIGEPFPIGLWGFPVKLRQRIGRGFAREANFRRLLTAATRPGVAWLAFICVFAGWHDPNAYNLAQGHGWVHNFEHISFFVGSLLFWWHIVGAGPHLHGRISVWARLAMLIGMIPINMIAGIVIATASEVIYTYYNTVPHIWGFTALEDQAIGGVIMWISGSEMVVWAVLFVLAGFSRDEDRRHPRLAVQWDSEEKMVAPGLEHRIVQNKWKKLAAAKAESSDILKKGV